jgi:hypothetical protein
MPGSCIALADTYQKALIGAFDCSSRVTNMYEAPSKSGKPRKYLALPTGCMQQFAVLRTLRDKVPIKLHDCGVRPELANF